MMQVCCYFGIFYNVKYVKNDTGIIFILYLVTVPIYGQIGCGQLSLFFGLS